MSRFFPGLILVLLATAFLVPAASSQSPYVMMQSGKERIVRLADGSSVVGLSDTLIEGGNQWARVFTAAIHASLPRFCFWLLYDPSGQGKHEIMILRGDTLVQRIKPIEWNRMGAYDFCWRCGPDQRQVLDVNFDGYKDLLLLHLSDREDTSGNRCWLFKPDEGRFVFSSLFSRPSGKIYSNSFDSTLQSSWSATDIEGGLRKVYRLTGDTLLPIYEEFEEEYIADNSGDPDEYKVPDWRLRIQQRHRIHPSLPLFTFNMYIDDLEDGNKYIAVNRAVIERGDGSSQSLGLGILLEDARWENGFVFTDYNFDGFSDIALVSGRGAYGNGIFSCWLYDPGQRSFVYHPILSEQVGFPERDSASRTLTFYNRHSGHGGATFSTFQLLDKEYVLVQVDYQERDYSLLYIRRYASRPGPPQLIYERRFACEDNEVEMEHPCGLTVREFKNGALQTVRQEAMGPMDMEAIMELFYEAE